MTRTLLLITLTIICIILSAKILFKEKPKGDFFIGTWTGGNIDSMVVKKAGQLYLGTIYFSSGNTKQYYTKFNDGCLVLQIDKKEVLTCPNDINSIFFGEYLLWRKVDE